VDSRYIPSAIVGDDCRPRRQFEALLKAEALPNFAKLWGREPGDCHKLCRFTIFDLAVVKVALHLGSEFSWVWLRSDSCRNHDGNLHSWIESDGYALDAANGCSRPIFILPAPRWRAQLGTVEAVTQAAI
jgi:hypothetical protein